MTQVYLKCALILLRCATIIPCYNIMIVSYMHKYLVTTYIITSYIYIINLLQ